MGQTIDVKLFVESVELIEQRNYSSRGLEVSVTELDVDSALDDIGIDNAIDYFDSDELLEKIGKDRAIAYFGIEEKE